MIYEIDSLGFSYAASAPILDGLSLTLGEGELLSVLGRNGAGKSTLFSCMLGLLKPQSGVIRLCGRPLDTLREREIASLVGYVPQNHVPTFAYTVFEFVLMGCASHIGMLSRPGEAEREAAREALAQMGIEDFAQRPYTELSGGERQQAAIARAIAARPRAILFDEPTAHLDFGNQIKVLRIIKGLAERGYSVAITTHDPNQALLLGGNAALFDGRGAVRTGSVDGVITEESLRAVYGADVTLRYFEEFGRNVCVYPRL